MTEVSDRLYLTLGLSLLADALEIRSTIKAQTPDQTRKDFEEVIITCRSHPGSLAKHITDAAITILRQNGLELVRICDAPVSQLAQEIIQGCRESAY